MSEDRAMNMGKIMTGICTALTIWVSLASYQPLKGAVVEPWSKTWLGLYGAWAVVAVLLAAGLVAVTLLVWYATSFCKRWLRARRLLALAVGLKETLDSTDLVLSEISDEDTFDTASRNRLREAVRRAGQVLEQVVEMTHSLHRSDWQTATQLISCAEQHLQVEMAQPFQDAQTRRESIEMQVRRATWGGQCVALILYRLKDLVRSHPEFRWAKKMSDRRQKRAARKASHPVGKKAA